MSEEDYLREELGFPVASPCTCATGLVSGDVQLRDPECPEHGEAMEPQNYDEIMACLEIVYGNTLPDATPKSVVRQACINRLREMRA